MASRPHPKGCIAVCVRFSVVAAAAVSPTSILDVRKRDLRWAPRGMDPHRWGAKLVTELAREYGIPTVVTEPDSPITAALERTDLKHRTLALEDAKDHVLEDFEASHGELYEHLLAEEPQLGVLIRFTRTGKIVMHARERTVQLLSVALGMAYQAAEERRSIRFENQATPVDPYPR
jgi:hypothetical protein